MTRVVRFQARVWGSRSYDAYRCVMAVFRSLYSARAHMEKKSAMTHLLRQLQMILHPAFHHTPERGEPRPAAKCTHLAQKGPVDRESIFHRVPTEENRLLW
jgi:uncharacterized protein (DUF2267 family)